MRVHVDGTTYEYREDEMTNIDAMAVEDATGRPFGEFPAALTSGSMRAITALVWLIQRRTNPGQEFADTRFSLATLDITDSEVEPGKDEVPTEPTSTST